jgi:hypothetical protein
MKELLFHTPWWLPTTIAGVGLVLFISGNSRQEARVRLAGTLLLAGAILLMVVSFFVDTDIEWAVKQTKALVRAIEKRDWGKAKAIMDPKTNLRVLNTFTVYNNGDDIIRGASEGVERYGLKNVIITSTRAEQADTVITVDMDVITEQEATMGRPLPSSWQFVWQESSNGWYLAQIINIKIAEATGEKARAQFPRATTQIR